MGLVDDDNRVGANDFFQRGANGIRQIQAGAVLHLFDEMRQDFSVCFALQVVPAVRQKSANGLMVFNDAIVNDGDATAASCVRMGVDVAGGAMCCPPVCPMPTVPTGVLTFKCASRLATFPCFNPENLVGLKGRDAKSIKIR